MRPSPGAGRFSVFPRNATTRMETELQRCIVLNQITTFHILRDKTHRSTRTFFRPENRARSREAQRRARVNNLTANDVRVTPTGGLSLAARRHLRHFRSRVLIPTVGNP
jgi:hypothetical protein